MAVNLTNLSNQLATSLNNVTQSKEVFRSRMVKIVTAHNQLKKSLSARSNKTTNTALSTRNISNNIENYNKINNAIKTATSANHLNNLKEKLNSGDLGKYSQQQTKNLERAILDKKFAISNTKTTTKNTAVKPLKDSNNESSAVVKYDFNTARKMTPEQLKTLAVKTSKQDAIKLFKDLRNGAYNTNLTKNEIKDISFTILRNHKLFN